MKSGWWSDRITRSDSTRDRWCLTYNERSRIVDQTAAMLGMTLEDAEYAPSASGDAGPSRIKRDREIVKKLQDMLSRFPTFDENDELTRPRTSDVAPEYIKSALLTAEAHGTEKIREFVDTWWCKQKVGFHDTLKLSQIPSQKRQTIIANINLCERLLVTKDSCRDVDLKNILRHEPLVLADAAGNLCPTNKVALGKILEHGVNAEVFPVSALKTCSITNGQTLVQAIGNPSGAKSFGDLADAFNTSVFSYFNQNCSI